MNEKLAQIFLENKLIIIDTKNLFEYSDGSFGPIYTDIIELISNIKIRKIIVDSFLELIDTHNIKFDAICGVATAAIPWASWLALENNSPLLYARQEPKDHGLKKTIEGNTKNIKRILVIEDVIGFGHSSLTACKN